MHYCDLHRHSLSTIFSPLARDSSVAVVFPASMLQSTSGMYKRTSSGVRTTASRLWLCRSPQRWLSFSPAITGLSYPEPPDFSRWRTFQVSPQVPAALPRPHQPSCADRFCCRHTAPVSVVSRSLHETTDFRFMTGRHAILSACRRFLVAQHPGNAGSDRGGRRSHCRLQRPLQRDEPY